MSILVRMVNFLERILQYPQYSRQFKCGDSLITAFSCPAEARLMKSQYSALWSQHNYLIYVVEGKKIWHTAQGAYTIQQDSCVFVRKGGTILEQFWDIGFCVIMFFIPDEFICDTLSSRTKPLGQYDHASEPIIRIESSDTLKGFFLSMASYFGGTLDPDPSLLELKFKELILTIADNADNRDLLSYFCSLLHEPQTMHLKRIMEDNFCYNLRLETFAALSNRSLSAFKRDFEKIYRTTPGKWLLERRLNYALHLLSHQNKNVSEAAFESGFESPSHFSRAFKGRFGKAPTEMKKDVTI